jgi:phage terminase large subunit-like protein
MVEAAWFPRYTPEDLPQKFHQIVQSWDTANKLGELADYSVCTTFGVKHKHFYLLNVLRKNSAIQISSVPSSSNSGSSGRA